MNQKLGEILLKQMLYGQSLLKMTKMNPKILMRNALKGEIPDFYHLFN